MMTTTKLLVFLTSLLAPYANAQCNVLNDTSLKTAVESWLNANSREEAELQYGGPIGDWDVSCCTKFNALFKFSTRFSEDLTKWDTSRAKSMDQLFEVATLFRGNVSTWDVSKVTSMKYIFSRSSEFDADLTGVSQWKTESLKDFVYAFSATAGFRGDLTNFDTSKVADFDHMFSDTLHFKADVSDWDLRSVKSLNYVFHFTKQFMGKVSGWKLSNAVQTLRHAFSDVVDFTPLDKEGEPITTFADWNTENVTDMSFFLQGSQNFNSDLVADWTTPNLEILTLAFAKSNNLHGSRPSSWSTSKVESFASLFATSQNFTSPLISSFDASGAKDMNSIFKYSHDFAGDVSQWKPIQLKTMEEFAYESVDFQGDVSAWDVSRVTSMAEAFYSVENFPISQLAAWDTAEVKHVRNMFDDAVWVPTEDGAGSGVFSPYALCWDVNKAAHWSLEKATCTSPGVGFDCDCINPALTEIINIGCDETTPPCVGDMTGEEETDDASKSVDDATLQQSPDREASSSARQQGFMKLAVLSSLSLLLLAWAI